MEEIRLRIKLSFHGGILSDSQKSEGLKKTWVLLKPQRHRTISDFCSYILQLFNLHESCPGGLLLYMDGFALPPFELTSILKDQDVISVKRKKVSLAIECNGAPVNAGPLLLANEELNKETGGYESEEPEEGENQVHDTTRLEDKTGKDAVSKKRKAPEKLRNSKKKKQRSEVKEPDIDDQAEHAKKLQLVLTGKKRVHKQKKITDSKEKDDTGTSEENATTPVMKTREGNVSMPVMKTREENGSTPLMNKNDNIQETGKDNVDATPKSEETPKHRSRSARRKSAKRQWLREMAKIQKANTDSQSEALKNWKEMQSKSGREDAAGQLNGNKTKADARSEALRNWKEMQSKSGREETAGQLNGHKTNADSRSEALRNWKEMQSKAGREEPTGQPNGRRNWKEMHSKAGEASGQPNRHQNWKWGQTSARSEEGVSQPNGCQNQNQGQTRLKSGQGVSPQKGNKKLKQGQTGVDNGEGLNLNESLANDMVKDSDNHIQSESKNNSSDKPNQNGDSEDETVVPVEIRPGHIRFEPLGKERTVEQSQSNMENFRWNGITSKKKGQKWGTEKYSFSQRNEHNDSNREQSEMFNAENGISSNKKGKKWGTEKSSYSQRNEHNDSIREQSEMPNAEKTTHSDEPFDFTKVPFLPDFPKEGDVIAYRLLELSSTWTPELSSYRVGKVSSCDSESGRVSLMPIPEFPIFGKKSDGDESLVQPDDSLYKEDGSLEIDFSSLVEVRILEDKTIAPGSSSECVVGNNSNMLIGTSDVQTPPSIPENRDLNDGSEQMHSANKENGVNLWDQFSEALNAKKEQLSQESNNWDKGSSVRSWSYNALRGSALGPTMAFLRSKNQI